MRFDRAVVLAIALLVSVSAMATAQGAPTPQPPLTPKSLQAALRKRLRKAAAEHLAEEIRAWIGEDALRKGSNAKVEELTVAWAIEALALSQPPTVVSADGKFRQPLTRLGATDVYAATVTLAEGAGMRWAYEVNGQKQGGGQLEVYIYPPETREQPGVPRGVLTQQPKWKSHVFEGSERDWWIYVPAQYRADTPACVMIFQDGGGMKNYVPVVFDNLIAKGEMPVTVAIFINPGAFPDGRSERSFEYDTLSDQYSRYLLEEILPEAEKTVSLRPDAASRAVCGLSSGGICAFTVAWQRPDQFSKVLSWIGSFTDIASGPTLIAGGHNYPPLIRKTPPKPIRVFLQDGDNDLDNEHGNWPLANQGMAKALAYKGYDYRFEFGHGFHSDQHGRALLPDSLRWLWRDYKP